MMIVGMDDIIASGLCGMPREHMEAMLEVAEQTNNIIGVRPVSVYATDFIKLGCPTKPFVLKNKTANVGVAAGLIVVAPEYCQVPPSQYEHYSDQLHSAMKKDPDLTPMMLALSEDRILGLEKLLGSDVHNGGIRVIARADDDDPTKTCYDIFWQQPSHSIFDKSTNAPLFIPGAMTSNVAINIPGKFIHVVAKPRTATMKQHSGINDFIFIDTATNSPIQVLGQTVTRPDGKEICLPITADYDLLAVEPLLEEYEPGGKDFTPLRIQGSPAALQRNLMLSSAPDYTGPKEDPKGGNWSKRTQEVTGLLNRAIGSKDPLRCHPSGISDLLIHNPVVQHSTEITNPTADVATMPRNFPCPFMLPRDFDLSSMGVDASKANERTILIETLAELVLLSEKIEAAGYHWSINAKYANIIPSRFASTRSSMENLFASVSLFSSSSSAASPLSATTPSSASPYISRFGTPMPSPIESPMAARLMSSVSAALVSRGAVPASLAVKRDVSNLRAPVPPLAKSASFSSSTNSRAGVSNPYHSISSGELSGLDESRQTSSSQLSASSIMSSDEANSPEQSTLSFFGMTPTDVLMLAKLENYSGSAGELDILAILEAASQESEVPQSSMTPPPPPTPKRR